MTGFYTYDYLSPYTPLFFYEVPTGVTTMLQLEACLSLLPTTEKGALVSIIYKEVG